MSAGRGSSQPETQATGTKEGKKVEAGCQVSITKLCAHPLPLVLPLSLVCFLSLSLSLSLSLLLSTSYPAPNSLFPPCDWGLESPKISDPKNVFLWMTQVPALTLGLMHFLLCALLSHRASTFPNTGPRPSRLVGLACCLRRGFTSSYMWTDS